MKKLIFIILTFGFIACQKEPVCQQSTCTRIWTSSYIACPDPKTGEMKIQSFNRDTMIETNVCDPNQWVEFWTQKGSEWQNGLETRKLLQPDSCFCQ